MVEFWTPESHNMLHPSALRREAPSLNIEKLKNGEALQTQESTFIMNNVKRELKNCSGWKKEKMFFSKKEKSLTRDRWTTVNERRCCI